MRKRKTQFSPEALYLYSEMLRCSREWYSPHISGGILYRAGFLYKSNSSVETVLEVLRELVDADVVCEQRGKYSDMYRGRTAVDIANGVRHVYSSD